MSMMTKEQAQRAIELLCERFGEPAPMLHWSHRSSNGRAWSKHWTTRPRIQIGPRCWRGVESAMVHEVAHIISPVPGHGLKFWQSLEKVAAAWYGDATRYPWKTEYASGKAYAGRRKLT